MPSVSPVRPPVSDHLLPLRQLVMRQFFSWHRLHHFSGNTACKRLDWPTRGRGLFSRHIQSHGQSGAPHWTISDLFLVWKQSYDRPAKLPTSQPPLQQVDFVHSASSNLRTVAPVPLRQKATSTCEDQLIQVLPTEHSEYGDSRLFFCLSCTPLSPTRRYSKWQSASPSKLLYNAMESRSLPNNIWNSS